MSKFTWGEDTLNAEGKLILLYRQQRVLDEGLIKPGDKVLDVGGWGKLSYRVYQEGCHPILFNIDTEHAAKIKERFPEVEVICGDIRTYNEFSEGQFDGVYCAKTLEHILEDRQSAFDTMFKVLKPGGIFVGTIPIPGIIHPLDDPTVDFIYKDELIKHIEEYATVITVEDTGSINKEDSPSSTFFIGKKNQL